MKTLILALLASVAAFAQGEYKVVVATTKLTVQQTANSGVYGNGAYALIYCTTASTATLSYNGTAATSTTATIYKGMNTFRSPTLTAWSASNVGSGSTLDSLSVPATTYIKLDLTAKPFAVRITPGSTGNNFTIATDNSCTITIAWTESAQ